MTAAQAPPILVIHGGAGAREGTHARFSEYQSHLSAIVTEAHGVLLRAGAVEAVIYAIRSLEDDPLFNAGTGAKLQKDGRARMSAALMDSTRGCFSGVINIQRVRNPIQVAAQLTDRKHSVLAGNHAVRYARRHGMPTYDPITRHRKREHARRVEGRGGTVGAVARDADAVLCAGTSTGGMGFETPGRVSDSATVAGTYASIGAGVSCTGIGEQIVNHAAAARVVTRVEDGSALQPAVDRTIAEADRLSLAYGLIGIAADGSWAVGETSAVTTLYAAFDGEVLHTFSEPG